MGVVTRHRSRRSCLDSNLRNTITAAQRDPSASIPMHNPTMFLFSTCTLTAGCSTTTAIPHMLRSHRVHPQPSFPVSLAQRPFFVDLTLPCMLTTSLPRILWIQRLIPDPLPTQPNAKSHPSNPIAGRQKQYISTPYPRLPASPRHCSTSWKEQPCP
jgi:hypothetical protein